MERRRGGEGGGGGEEEKREEEDKLEESEREDRRAIGTIAMYQYFWYKSKDRKGLNKQMHTFLKQSLESSSLFSELYT